MIRFGTSGWRDVISDRFTFENVRRVTRAVALYLKAEAGLTDRGVAVGYDTRFMSEDFAAEAARVLQDEGIPAHLAVDFLPTPALAFAITENGFAGGLNITASHNPPEYNGIKFSTGDGAPAPPEVTRQVEGLVEKASGAPAAAAEPPARLDIRDAYFARLETIVRVDALRSAGLRVAVDSRFGTTRGWLDVLLQRHGVEVIKIHDRRDPLFGGSSPDCSGANLDDLRQVVLENGLDLGLATDGDGDRFGIVDGDGSLVTPNLIVSLLVDHLARTRGWSEGVGRTVATTHLIDRVAAHHGFQVHETPVGFKYFNPLLERGEIFMGAEESAGMSVKGHVPEKDGILACMLVAEMVAATGQGLGRLTEDLFARVGTVLTRRVDRRFPDGMRAELLRRSATAPDHLAGMPVVKVVNVDGAKWIREDGSWLLVRFSGTEPVVRIYTEAPDAAGLDALVEAGIQIVS